MLWKMLDSYVKYETCKNHINNSHCSAQSFQSLLKMLSKDDPFLMTDNISVNFEICMLPMQMKGSSAIQKKKLHFSTRVNAFGSALTSTAVLKQAL